MTRFYGGVQGSRGEATRLGHRELTVWGKSWSLKATIRFWRDSEDQEHLRVYVEDLKSGEILNGMDFPKAEG